MAEEQFDVIVIGGGPGGSTTATLLARRGRKVVVLEKERFPRFHIGESLLPRNMEVFEELGVVGKLERHGFIRKYGGEFVAGNGEGGFTFRFRNGLRNRYPDTFQVLRAEFDKLLLDHSRENGADVREEHLVHDVRISPGDGVEVEVGSAAGRQTLRAKMLVDASGRDTFLANKLRLKQPIATLKKIAVFAHFRGGHRADGQDAGNTVLIRVAPGSWFWFIPLHENRVSVGLVTDGVALRERGGDGASLFTHWIERSPVMQARLKGAERISPFQVTSDFSYRSRQSVGDHWLMVGDSAAFLDPIFSTGVLLAMSSGSAAAKLIEDALGRSDFSARLFRSYEQKQQRHIDLYFGLIFAYYRPEMMDLFVHPQNPWNVQSAVNSLLAGNVDAGFPLWSRMYLFYFLMWLQKRFGLVPRIEYDRVPEQPRLYPEDCPPAGNNPEAVKAAPRTAAT
jgi:flavin-dependent dehydrogenase